MMAMPLSVVQVGRPVRMVSVEAGRCLQTRLAAMGLVPGVEIEVLRNLPRGPFIVAVKGTRVMLWRGMAQRITVA